jgi:cell division protein FtsL
MTDYAKSIIVITLTVAVLIVFLTWAAVPKQRTISDAAMSGPIFQPTHWRVY